MEHDGIYTQTNQEIFLHYNLSFWFLAFGLWF